MTELDPAYVEDVVRRALAEDLAGGVDVTSTATVPAGQSAAGDLVARAPGVVAGLPVAAAVFAAVDPAVRVQLAARDGDRVRRGAVLATVTGPAIPSQIAGLTPARGPSRSRAGRRARRVRGHPL